MYNKLPKHLGKYTLHGYMGRGFDFVIFLGEKDDEAHLVLA